MHGLMSFILFALVCLLPFFHVACTSGDTSLYHQLSFADGETGPDHSESDGSGENDVDITGDGQGDGAADGLGGDGGGGADGDIDAGPGSGDGDRQEEFPFCGVDDFEKRLPPLAVYYGTDTPTLFDMSEGQQLALGALMAQDPWGWGGYMNFCTGTVISARVVLTAAHCLSQAGVGEIGFAVGPNADAPVELFEVESYTYNPLYNPYSLDPAAHDTGVLILAESVFDRLPDIEPIPIRRDPLPQSLVGQMVQNGGYGATEVLETNSLRFWVAERVDAVGFNEFTVNGMGQGGVCFGDSGGGSFYDFGDGLRVIGTVSWGDESCSGIDHFADLSADTEWIDTFLSQANDCGSIDEVGICSGDVARWCENEQLVEQDCARTGEICGRMGNGLFRCMPDPCGGVTFQGYCDEGEVARWCEDGELRWRKCIPCGQVCDWTGEKLGYYCVFEPSTSSACGSVTNVGCCYENVAVWCDELADMQLFRDCGEEGCGWDSEINAYFCGGSGEDPDGVYPKNCW